MILALDPSSTVTGWACMEAPQELLEGGLIRPARCRLPVVDRIRGMVQDVAALLDEFTPADIVIEITSGKVGLHRHAGGGAGLAVYGMAVGSIWQDCEHWAAEHTSRDGATPRVHPVAENEWTRRVPKSRRTAAVARLFHQYDPASDPGGDLADAIGLGLWFLRNQLTRCCLLSGGRGGAPHRRTPFERSSS